MSGTLKSALALAAMAMALFAAGVVAQGPAAPSSPPAPVTTPKGTLPIEVLTGAWVRPDGGYVIVIKSVAANGQLEASYFNPKPLPFAKAQATRDGTTIRIGFELRAGGYDGSTYDLTYDPVSDRLKGTYYQAVAKQKFDVYFVRK